MDLWLIRTDQPAPVRAAMRELLDAEELARADAATDPARGHRFTVAHGAAREIAGRYAGRPGAALSWRRGPHGKPELVGVDGGLAVNLSGCEELALFAVARGREVGVDVERLSSPTAAVRLATRYFHPAEAAHVAAGGPAPGGEVSDGADAAAGEVSVVEDTAAGRFARLWTRKEAYVKAYGARLADGLGVPVGGAGQFLVTGRIGLCLVEDFAVPGPFRAAVALRGAGPYRTRGYEWPDR